MGYEWMFRNLHRAFNQEGELIGAAAYITPHWWEREAELAFLKPKYRLHAVQALHSKEKKKKEKRQPKVS